MIKNIKITNDFIIHKDLQTKEQYFFVKTDNFDIYKNLFIRMPEGTSYKDTAYNVKKSEQTVIKEAGKTDKVSTSASDFNIEEQLGVIKSIINSGCPFFEGRFDKMIKDKIIIIEEEPIQKEAEPVQEEVNQNTKKKATNVKNSKSQPAEEEKVAQAEPIADTPEDTTDSATESNAS